jgi:signal transduction histidine kinase
LAPLARRERNLSLVHSSEAGLPSALADPERLVQVLSNLVRNAINYTPDSGIISVTTTSTGDRIGLTVADTGIGMAPEEVQQIFDRFYRSDQSRSRDSGGSGLGLAIVRELLTAMGADIQVESALGLGSTFRILLRKAET